MLQFLKIYIQFYKNGFKEIFNIFVTQMRIGDRKSSIYYDNVSFIISYT
jgi:hypothetical protein